MITTECVKIYVAIWTAGMVVPKAKRSKRDSGAMPQQIDSLHESR